MPREKKPSGRRRWRLWLGAAAFLIAAASTALAAAKVRAHLLTDPTYVLSRDNPAALTIQGMLYASRTKVARVFAGDFGRSVFAVPLDERRRRLLAIDWVEDASVARVWPDRLIVRLRERRPVAFVTFGARALLIDRHGVLLEQPARAQFSFPLLTGVHEDGSDEQRSLRVEAMLALEADLGYLAKDVSEIDAADPENIRMVVKPGARAVELTMGNENFAARYQNFLAHYTEIEKHSPGARSFDLRQDDRITAQGR